MHQTKTNTFTIEINYTTRVDHMGSTVALEFIFHSNLDTLLETLICPRLRQISCLDEMEAVTFKYSSFEVDLCLFPGEYAARCVCVRVMTNALSV